MVSPSCLQAVSGIVRAVRGRCCLQGEPIHVTGKKGRCQRSCGSVVCPCPGKTASIWALVVKFDEARNSILRLFTAIRNYLNGVCLDISTRSARDAAEKIEKYGHFAPPNHRLEDGERFLRRATSRKSCARKWSAIPWFLFIGSTDRLMSAAIGIHYTSAFIEMRDAGKRVLLVSVELDEIRSLSRTGSW